MSPHAANSLIGDLVEMAKAAEELPQVRIELVDARIVIDSQAATIQRLELKLMERASQIDDLNAKLRTTEGQRDDAELRFLEADDKIMAFRRLLGAFETDISGLLKATEAEANPTTHSIPDQSSVGVVDHTNNPSVELSGDHPLSSSVLPADAPPSTGSENSKQEGGERAEGPTSVTLTENPPASPASSQEHAHGTLSEDHTSTGESANPFHAPTPPTPAPSTTATSQDGANERPKGRFFGRKYYDVPQYVPIDLWLAQGGTQEDYDWRPEQSRSPNYPA